MENCGGSVLRKAVNLQRVPALDSQLVCGLSACAAPKASQPKQPTTTTTATTTTTTTMIATTTTTKTTKTTTTATITIARRSVVCVDLIPSLIRMMMAFAHTTAEMY